LKGAGKWAFWRFHWLVRHRIVVALERARAHAHGQLLDVGCGSKPFAPVLAGQVERYIGVDLPASEDLSRTSERQPGSFARAEALPFRDASFDTLLSLSVINYLVEPRAFLVEGARVLKPGGVALLDFTQMTPNHPRVPDYYRFTRTAATRLLEQAGFDVLDAIPIGGLMARVGLALTEGLQSINRGPQRVLTEIPIRLLYVILQLGFDVLDRVWVDPHEVIGHLMVARKR